MSAQKNQLEIEKHELEERYKSLQNDYSNLSKKLDDFQNQEKIDELNQETDTLLDEIDKWQT